MSGGQVVGGAVGAVAGFFLAGPFGVAAATGALYGAQIGMMAGGYLDPLRGPTVNGPRLDDLTVQTSTYGAVIPRVYGSVAVTGNVIWLENNALTETGDLVATIGRTNLLNAGTGEVRSVAQVIRHPRYQLDAGDYDNDLAVLTLSSPSTRTPIELTAPHSGSDRASWLPGSNATVIGWGRTCETCSGTNILQEVVVPILPDSYGRPGRRLRRPLQPRRARRRRLCRRRERLVQRRQRRPAARLDRRRLAAVRRRQLGRRLRARQQARA